MIDWDVPIPPEYQEWLTRAFKENKSGIEKSGVFLSLFSGNMIKDSLACLQLGIAIMLDKPIVVLADQLEQIPRNLRKIAIVVDVIDKKNPERAFQQTKAALERADVLLKKDGR